MNQRLSITLGQVRGVIQPETTSKAFAQKAIGAAQPKYEGPRIEKCAPGMHFEFSPGPMDNRPNPTPQKSMPPASAGWPVAWFNFAWPWVAWVAWAGITGPHG